jgi:tRNA dimethylallyltransferase
VKSSSKYNLITILGHTAASKTAVAAHLAKKMDTEIISADSRQVYRNMDLGTGKDIDDYYIDGIQIPYHLIDIADAGYKYNVFEFQKDFVNAFNNILSKNKTPILCGGTGMYLESVLKGYKLIHVPVNDTLRNELSNKSLKELTQILGTFKSLHNTTDLDTVKRAVRAIEIETYYADNPEIETDFPEIRSLLIGIKYDRNSRRKRITLRLEQRLKEGMIEEVEMLVKQGLTKDDLMYYGLEYKYLALYHFGDLTFNEMKQKLETAIHQFAKRQMTWFRGMERKGFKIHWLDGYMPLEEKLDKISSLFME